MLSLRIPSPPLSSSQPSDTSNNGCTTFTTRTSTTSRSRRNCGWLACKGGEKEATKLEVDNERALEALEKLDKELQTLSNNQTLQPNMVDKKKKTPYPPKPTYNDSDVNMTTKEMPEFSESFLVYSAVLLLAITFLYNMLFILVIKPAVDVV